MTPRQEQISSTVERLGGNLTAAARELGVNRSTVSRAYHRAQRTVSGAAHPVRPSTIHTRCRRIFVLPDVHVPYHDEAAYAVAVRAAKELRPDVLVIIGDYVDCYAVSSFPKSPERRQDLKYEVDRANECLDALTGVAQSTIFCEGNHENRLERYLCQRAPELYGMITVKDLLRMPERGWQWVPYKQWTKIGKVAFAHEVGHAGKGAAMQSLASFGGNIVFGHSHRAGVVYGGTVEGDRHFALNVGWLGDFNVVDYAHRSQMRDWQHGFGWIEQDDAGNSWAQFCPIVKGRVVVSGRVFE